MDLREVFNYLLISVLFLMTFSFLVFHLSRDITTDLRGTLIGNVYLSISGIIISSVMLHYAIIIPGAKTVIDLSGLVLITGFYLGGTIPVIFSTITGSILYIVLYGFGDAAIHYIIRSVLCIILFNIIHKIVKENSFVLKWYLKLATVVMITVVSYNILLNDINYTTFLLHYGITMFVVGSLQFVLLETVRKSNNLFNVYKDETSKDYLTELKNPHTFQNEYNKAIEHSRGSREPLTYIIVDIDHFKQLRDTYGQIKAEMLIKEIANLLSLNFPKNAIMARIVREEFYILLPNTSVDNAYEKADYFRKLVKSHDFKLSSSDDINVTVSIGVANFPKTTPDVDKLKDFADLALYTAKHSGRDKTCVR